MSSVDARSLEMFQVKCLWLFVCLGCLLYPIDGATKTWKFTNDILDPKNWEGGKPSKDCKGIIFPHDLNSVGSVFELYISEVVLPFSGELEIREGGFIEIGNASSCIRVKEMQHRYWLSSSSWDFGENAAVPDAERVPCIHDDVVFSSEATVAVLYPEVTVSVNSIQIGGINLSNEQWHNFLQSDYGGEQFYTLEFETSAININPRQCTSRIGCTCHDSDDILYWVCDNMEKREEAPCFDPITPIGHCGGICGGVVVVETSLNFALEDFQTRIPKYAKVDTYASRVTKDGKAVVQVVFAEREEFAELSSDAASNFYGLLSRDLDGFNLLTASWQTSGIRIPEGSAAGTAFTIILGTLTAASIVFLCLYVVYLGPLKDYDFSSRLPITQFSFGNLRPFLFAKFENREEGQMSMAASMVSLEKAFDNPMYRSHRPSTSSAGVEVVVLTETEPTTSETRHENPTFTEMKYEQVEIEDVGDVED